jgi:hypothetical protein
MRPAKHRRRAQRDPASVYATPADLARSPHFTPTEKLELLARWETDARAIEGAEVEGMPASGTSALGEVRDARRSLEKDLAPRATPVPRPADAPGEATSPPEALPKAMRRHPVGWRALLLLCGVALVAAAVALWISGLAGWALVPAGLAALVLWAVARSHAAGTDVTCTTCGGSGFVPAEGPSGSPISVACPICVPNDAPGG